MTVEQYLQNISALHRTGHAREHAYRGDLANLIMSIVPDVLVTNEPARIHCGAPDYVLTRGEISVGYIEAKDIGVDLESSGLQEQFERYKAGLDNLIFTDYLKFRFYRYENFITEIAIGEIKNGQIIPFKENFDQFCELIRNFSMTITQTIKSPTRLAELMAVKARLMADVIEKSLDYDDEVGNLSNIKKQMLSFQQMLIHDITNKSFADIYAQTIAYGMFAARYHDPTLPTFTRQEAATLIPRSNPFLRRLFQDIAGYDLDRRLDWIVEDLVKIFLASDVALIMKNFGKTTRQEDPVVHFYETFLGRYNKKLKIERGVWYTPQPVVDFIVRAVDDILKKDFDLMDGLADTSKIKIKTKTHKLDNRSKKKSIITGEQDYEQTVHRVQILDPATGTGTFLAEVIRLIYKKFDGKQGIWSKYVASDLIPRLNGFELLMASYAMAHLKIDMLLTDTGYTPQDDQRLRIFLTNSLEEGVDGQINLFNWLADEANQANAVKRDTPVMVVIGNPPYSANSSNKGKWITNLMKDYRKEPGGLLKLKERNSKSISSDEYKFIRYGQHFINRNKSGILAFINPHTFLDAAVFRGVRWNLLNTFDKIYIIDLHGNKTKKETSPDGSIDANVFDIKQGVSINIFVKTGNKQVNELAEVFHVDLYGTRNFKYDFLTNNNIETVGYTKVEYKAPFYKFAPEKHENHPIENNVRKDEYFNGLEIEKLFPFRTSGVKTHGDDKYIDYDQSGLMSKINGLGKEFQSSKVFPYSYRPFDKAYIYYDPKLLGRAREKTIHHLKNDNLSLVLVPQSQAANLNYFDCAYVADCMTDTNLFRRGGPSAFPLYLYAIDVNQKELDNTSLRTPNLNLDIVKKIVDSLGLPFVSDKDQSTEAKFSPIDIIHYVYAVLYSPAYREKYKEFLKTEYPRVPIPSNQVNFWKLVQLGQELTQVHLLQSPNLEHASTSFNISGSDIVGKVTFDDEKVYINAKQYFANIPRTIWDFTIGGYEPAQQWLKRRKDRELTYKDISEYQKVIEAIKETDRIMKDIDSVMNAHNATL